MNWKWFQREMLMNNKDYYLSLSLKEKIKLMQHLINYDLTTYFIVAKYYLNTPIEDGGVSPKVIDREFRLAMKRKHYYNKKNKKLWL